MAWWRRRRAPEESEFEEQEENPELLAAEAEVNAMPEGAELPEFDPPEIDPFEPWRDPEPPPGGEQDDESEAPGRPDRDERP